jgi:hypothetical protein
MNFRLKYRLRRFRVWFRKIWAIISLSKKEQYSTDIDLAIKIVKRMLSKPDVDIRHSPIRSVFHVKHGHLYAKISDNSITVINGKYAYELLLPIQAGYELMQKMRMISERRLMKAEDEHRKRIDRSLLNIYNDLDEPEDQH